MPPADPLTTTAVDDERFMGEEDHRKIRSYTTLLQMCDEYRQQEACDYLQGSRSTGSGRRSLASKQNLMNILVRNQEKLALTTTGNVQSGNAQAFIIRNDCLLSHWRTMHVQARTEQHGRALRPETDILEFVRARHVEARQYGSAEIPFAAHVGYAHELLLNCHEAPTNLELHSRQDSLRTYVYAASYRKMLERVTLGKASHGRDLFDVLTTRAPPLTIPLWWQHDLYRYRSLRAPPTVLQVQVMNQFALDSPKLLLPDWNPQREPLYGKRSHHQLQIMLAQLLFCVDGALQNVQDTLKGQQLAELESKESRPRIHDVILTMSKLNKFLEAFDHGRGRSGLARHLEWLLESRERRTWDASGSGNDAVDELDEVLTGMSYAKLNFCTMKERWAQKALAYLRLICQHEASIVDETSRNAYRPGSAEEQHRVAVLAESKVVVIDVLRGPLDSDRNSLSSCID